MIRALLAEYGAGWLASRWLYSAKLKMLAVIPAMENLFERKADIKRIDIFDLDVRSIKSFLRGLPEEKRAGILRTADKAVNGVITGFSRLELDYGNPIDWHYNPLTGAGSREDARWFRIPDFDPGRGDIKAIWEASRFTHLLYFARAYLISDDKKYYAAFSGQLGQWLKSNPYSYGANYKCGQECTLRMINALIAYAVFKSSGAASAAEDERNMFRLVEACYKKVLSNFFYAHRCIRNNHTFSEICGLIIGAWCCKDEAGVKRAYMLLDQEIKGQFLPDGGYKQYSFNYQRFALQIIECIYKISVKTERRITETGIIKASVLQMYQIQAENGDMPNFGPNDGALIFPVTACGFRDFRPVLNTVFALVEGKRLYGQGEYDEELLWFGNGAETPLADIEREASAFGDSGFYTLRHDGGFLMTCLQDFRSRPGHLDQLHIDLWHKGVNVFCDSGTYSYAGGLGKELASTSGHNTVMFAGLEQMNTHGAFLVYDWTARGDVGFDAGCFTGTMISRNGYIHKRTIFKTERGYAVEDEIKGHGKDCVFFFHTPCQVRIIAGGARLFDGDTALCTLAADNGDMELQKAARSLYYLEKEEISRICVKCRMKGDRCHARFEISFEEGVNG